MLYRSDRVTRKRLSILYLALSAVTSTGIAAEQPRAWITDAAHRRILEQVPLSTSTGNEPITIDVDASRRFQHIDGFGFALTGGSALVIQRMSPAARHALLSELFGHGPSGIGVSWIRISIGSSDMDDGVFTYDDLTAGGSDPALARFSLAPDERALIPTLREILAIAPGLPILASPWSAPSWMKTNDRPKGGMLRADMGNAFARYLVAYVRGMTVHGVPITMITLQNEPENPNNTPSMLMSAAQQAELIAEHVGPAFRAAGLATRIVAFDHNCDHPGYPLAILGNEHAAQFVAGTGFHLYAGDVSAMTRVHDAHPDKSVWLTEQSVTDDPTPGGPTPVAGYVSRILVGSLENWAQGVLLWNLAADSRFGPHTGDGGCSLCAGAVTIDGDHVTRNVAYAAIAPFSRFVPPGSVRIGTVASDPNLPVVAFRTQAGEDVLVVANPASSARSVRITDEEEPVAATVPAGAVLAVQWPGSG